MKIYCYYFRMNGTVEKEKVTCRKNKSEYAFNYERTSGFIQKAWVTFSDIGNIYEAGSSFEGEKHCGCRMYLEEDIEITEKMTEFAKARAEKVREFEETKKRFQAEVEELKNGFKF